MQNAIQCNTSYVIFHIAPPQFYKKISSDKHLHIRPFLIPIPKHGIFLLPRVLTGWHWRRDVWIRRAEWKIIAARERNENFSSYVSDAISQSGASVSSFSRPSHTRAYFLHWFALKNAETEFALFRTSEERLMKSVSGTSQGAEYLVKRIRARESTEIRITSAKA